jgi:hypothetical protein
MPENVTGYDLRARADGLKTVVEGDSSVFTREALLAIIQDVKADLVRAADMMERHELNHRDSQKPNGPTVGGQLHAPGPATIAPPPPPVAHAEAASDDARHEIAASAKQKSAEVERGKGKVER